MVASDTWALGLEWKPSGKRSFYFDPHSPSKQQQQQQHIMLLRIRFAKELVSMTGAPATFWNRSSLTARPHYPL
jgi:hypothetical protein